MAIVPQLAVALAPTAIKLGANLLRGDRKTPYQEQLSSMSDIFEQQATGPITENRFYQSGKRQIERADEERRDRITDSMAGTGATNEARLAKTEDANRVYSDALRQLFDRAQRYREQMQGRYLNLLGAQEKARLGANQRFQERVNQFAQPAGTAARAFLMSSIFNDNEDEPEDDKEPDQYDLREGHRKLYGY